ncbi:hypothetical protein AJ80_06490 [Polytolypa hystricis UAMH7299]|uniref:RED-like N-terminal domain-containing protein n=1 Tax=Polytolypa hystricis (strain UAMH7299) TaxID=1447883 RepID=A0A2B7XUX2_POLH7|nr:hypothetical protein AJ80_06490 [Polytolypa hystricis UAMH7299]
MNNQQFRRLLSNAPPGSKSQNLDGRSPRESSAGAASTPRPSALGSRMRSSIPMTPRSVTGVDFARQLAEHQRESQQPPTKKFKSSAAPKGTKLPEGYDDRTQQRRLAEGGENEDEEGMGRGGDSLEERIRALEDLVKLGQIDQDTFERLRSGIGVGGDVKSTHLVKGLDWKLLQRAREGEDISKAPAQQASVREEEPNIDEEFEKLLDEKEKDVKSIEREEKVKKGAMAPPAIGGGKMTRDEILRQLKASRLAAASAQPQPSEEPASTLGTRFKKIGAREEKKRWIETDKNGRRREVLLVRDLEGKTKRKVRWIDGPSRQNQTASNGLLVPDKDTKPLGMDVPAEILSRASVPVEEEDDDIFQDAGEYNPLGDIVDDDDSSSESEGEVKQKDKPASKVHLDARDKIPPSEANGEEVSSTAPQAKPRNYFATSSTTTADTANSAGGSNPLISDPTILAALKRAAAIGDGADRADSNPDAEKRQKNFLEEARRREMQDSMDMDLGFGGSRFADDEDEEGVWDERGGVGNKRKRGPKKRKGDKENADDVMRVLEGRKKVESSGKGVGKAAGKAG